MQVVAYILFLCVWIISLGCGAEFRWRVNTVRHCLANVTNAREDIYSRNCSVCTVGTDRFCSGKIERSSISDICGLPKNNCVLPEYWDNGTNWLSDKPFSRTPCRTDTVVFPDNYTLPRVIVNMNVTVLGLKVGINMSQYFIFQNGSNITIDADCIEASPCSCGTSLITPLIKVLIVVLMVGMITTTCVVVSVITSVFLVRKFTRVQKRKVGGVFTFQTLDELEIDDETDRFDVMAINSVEEFPSGKSQIPADLTGLLDEDSVNGEGQNIPVKSHQKKVRREDKQSLLNSQDQVFVAEDQEQIKDLENTDNLQTDL